MPAVLRSGVLVALAACWGSRGGGKPAPMPTSLEPSAHDPTGYYWCSIDDKDDLEFRCEIARRGRTLRLEKVSGAERIRGDLKLHGDRLEFTGERYCMWEDCTSKLVGTFVPTGNGMYEGTFKDAPLVVRLAPMPDAQPEPQPQAQPSPDEVVDTAGSGAP